MQGDHRDPLSIAHVHTHSRLEDEVSVSAQEATAAEQPRIRFPQPDAQISAIANIVMSAAGHGLAEVNDTRNGREITARMNRHQIRRGHAAIAARSSNRIRRVAIIATGITAAAIAVIIAVPNLRALVSAERTEMVQASQPSPAVDAQNPTRSRSELAEPSSPDVEVSAQLPPPNARKELLVQPEITITPNEDPTDKITKERMGHGPLPLRGQISMSNRDQKRPRVQLPDPIYPDTTTSQTAADRQSTREVRSNPIEREETSRSPSSESARRTMDAPAQDAPRVVVTVREETHQNRTRRSGSRALRLDPWDDHSPGDIGGPHSSDD